MDKLSDRADKHEWHASKVRKQNRKFFSLSRHIAWADSSPKTFVCVLFIASSLIACTCWLLPKWSLVAAKFDKKWDFLTYFGTVWTLQATLAALVYPIVISFVAVLIQRRSSSNLGLRLYMRDVAALPVGLSALALTVVMGFQYVFLPYAELEVVAAMVAASTVWFVFNTLITIWFLRQTFRYLDDSFRLMSFEKYAVEVALPNAVRKTLMCNIFSSAVHNDIIPGKNGSDEDHVILTPIKTGEPEVSVLLAPEMVVYDVRLRLLKYAVQLWLSEVYKHKGPVTSSVIDGEPKPLMVIPVRIGAGYERQVLCRIDGPIKLSKLSAILIKLSFIYKKQQEVGVSIECKDILEELMIEILDLINAKRFEAANQTLMTVVGIHARLVQAGAFRNDNGSPNNVALLVKPYSWASQPPHQEWVWAYKPVIEEVTSDLASNEKMLGRCCRISYYLVNKLKDEDIQLLIFTLNTSTYFMYRLADWWKQQVESRDYVQYGPNDGITLPPSSNLHYTKALKAFIEGWEATNLWLGDLPTELDSRWALLSKRTRFQGAHLERLAELLLSAIARGDKSAALWLNDSFLGWWQRNQYDYRDQYDYDDQFHRLTLCDLSSSWSEIAEKFNLAKSPHQSNMQDKVLSVAIYRYWSDLRLIVALTMLQWTSVERNQDSLALQFAMAQILNVNLRDGDNQRNDAFRDSAKVFERLYKIALGDEKYYLLMESFAERVNDLTRGAVISGRIYARHGERGLGLLRGSMLRLVVAMFQIESVWQQLESRAITWLDEDSQKTSSAIYFIEQLIVELKSPNFNEEIEVARQLRLMLNIIEPLQVIKLRTQLEELLKV